METGWLAAGFIVATLVSVTGVGGGAIMTPLLVFGLGVSPQTAIGTDLLYAVMTKSGAVVLHVRAGRVRWNIVCRMLSGSLPAAAVALGTLAYIDTRDYLEGILKAGLGAVLALTAGAILLRDRFQTVNVPERNEASVIAFVASGVLLGTMVALTSVGAGALGVVLMVFLLPQLSAREIVATDLAHALPLTLVAGLGHLALGHVDWGMLAYLLLGAGPGVVAGSWLSGTVSDVYLRRGLATVLIMASALMMF